MHGSLVLNHHLLLLRWAAPCETITTKVLTLARAATDTGPLQLHLPSQTTPIKQNHYQISRLSPTLTPGAQRCPIPSKTAAMVKRTKAFLRKKLLALSAVMLLILFLARAARFCTACRRRCTRPSAWSRLAASSLRNRLLTWLCSLMVGPCTLLCLPWLGRSTGGKGAENDSCSQGFAKKI